MARHARSTAGEYVAGLGWAATYLALWSVIVIGSSYFARLAGHAAPIISPLVQGAIKAGGVLALTLLFRRTFNRSDMESLGIAGPRGSWLAIGLLAGTLSILCIGIMEYSLGWLHPLAMQLSPRAGTPRMIYLLLYAVPCVGVGVAEELGFRGYVFETLADRGPAWVAALVSAAIFAGLHFTLGGFGAGFLLTTILMAIMLQSLRWLSGSLWLPIGFHSAWDYVQIYVVGLSTTGSGASDPALIPIVQSGPTIFVGSAPAIEGGLLFCGMIALILMGLALFGLGRSASWRSFSFGHQPDS